MELDKSGNSSLLAVPVLGSEKADARIAPVEAFMLVVALSLRRMARYKKVAGCGCDLRESVFSTRWYQGYRAV